MKKNKIIKTIPKVLKKKKFSFINNSNENKKSNENTSKIKNNIRDNKLIYIKNLNLKEDLKEEQVKIIVNGLLNYQKDIEELMLQSSNISEEIHDILYQYKLYYELLESNVGYNNLVIYNI
jgi:hypothetical protein